MSKKSKNHARTANQRRSSFQERHSGACWKTVGRPLQRRDIVERLKWFLTTAGKFCGAALQAMERDGQLVKNRRNAYGLPAKMDLVAGRISAHKDGYGFVMPDDGESTSTCPRGRCAACLHGDRVLASVIGIDARGRQEGAVREILERAHERVVGVLSRKAASPWSCPMIPDQPGHTVPLQDTNRARPGQVVVAEILQQPGERQPPVGRVIEILGKSGAPGMATEIAIRNLRFAA